MPAARLPPGLYERLLSLALDQDIQGLDPRRFAAKTEAPEETERPRLLARYILSLLSLALDAQKGNDAEAKQPTSAAGSSPSSSRKKPASKPMTTSASPPPS